ncbi:MAG TPA: hypothetical protein VL020_01950, partial [Pseudomonadales bacterium]|nr:hypothetical protein [Pseudomonadales bacterium]
MVTCDATTTCPSCGDDAHPFRAIGQLINKTSNLKFRSIISFLLLSCLSIERTLFFVTIYHKVGQS